MPLHRLWRVGERVRLAASFAAAARAVDRGGRIRSAAPRRPHGGAIVQMRTFDEKQGPEKSSARLFFGRETLRYDAASPLPVRVTVPRANKTCHRAPASTVLARRIRHESPEIPRRS